MEALNVPLIPPKDMVFEFLGRCSKCGLHDHLRVDCPGVCPDCQLLGLKCSTCLIPNSISDPPQTAANDLVQEESFSSAYGPLLEDSLSGPLSCGYRCLELDHFKWDCINNIRCLSCFGWGHVARKCPLKQACSFCHKLGHVIGSCPRITGRRCKRSGHLDSCNSPFW